MPAKLPDGVRRVPVSMKLPPALVERCAARAAQLGMTKTAFYERALEAALGSGVPAGRAAPREAPAPRPVAPAPIAGDRAAAFRAAASRRRSA